MFYFDEINDCKVLRSDFLSIDIGINAFFTTRDCPYPLSEDIIKVDENEKEFKLSKSPYFSEPVRIINPEQTHSDHVEGIDERCEYPNTDGLIVSDKNTAIFLRFADCTPIILFDPIKKVAAIAHAGWRGTAARIGVKTVAKMVLNYSAKPENIIAVIGPAISRCCYEVSDDVKDSLLSSVKTADDLYRGNYVDLKKINEAQLKEIGIKKIDVCPYCTSCNNDLFYSYRKENGTTERHYAVLKLKDAR